MEPASKQEDANTKGTLDWPHAPPHRLAQGGVYFVTARTAERRHLLADDAMKDWFQVALLELAKEFGWRLEAWAVLANHYHFIAHSPESAGAAAGADEGSEGGAESLRAWVRKLHSLATKELNRRENQPGRTRLWQNYRETRLTHQHSYLARLHYVHHNAVHHGLVRAGADWPWCSARAFQAAVTPAWYKTVTSFRYEVIAEKDEDVM